METEGGQITDPSPFFGTNSFFGFYTPPAPVYQRGRQFPCRSLDNALDSLVTKIKSSNDHMYKSM